jgi:hypothetical protein
VQREQRVRELEQSVSQFDQLVGALPVVAGLSHGAHSLSTLHAITCPHCCAW